MMCGRHYHYKARKLRECREKSLLRPVDVQEDESEDG